MNGLRKAKPAHRYGQRIPHQNIVSHKLDFGRWNTERQQLDENLIEVHAADEHVLDLAIVECLRVKHRHAQYARTMLPLIIVEKPGDSVFRSEVQIGSPAGASASEYCCVFHRHHIQLCAKEKASERKSGGKFKSGRLFAHF